MNRLLVFFLCLIVFESSSLCGQEYSYPVLPQKGTSLNDFIPKGWFLLDSATGELHGDGHRDIVFVIQLSDTVDELRPDSSVLHTSPRILAVIFDKGQTYDLFTQNNTFILRNGEGGMDPDPVVKLQIENGLFHIEYPYGRPHFHYTFRLQSKDLYLISASQYFTWADNYDAWDIDFTTKQAEHSWGQIGEDFKPNTEWKDIITVHQKKIDEMVMTGMWEVINGVFF
jgi:hypothetical protein